MCVPIMWGPNRDSKVISDFILISINQLVLSSLKKVRGNWLGERAPGQTIHVYLCIANLALGKLFVSFLILKKRSN